MVDEIRAIETRYAGCRFRSRLEARWAVFFDRLGLQWEYEPQGFEMADGSRYLPDFHLPAMPMVYVEVKGSHARMLRDAPRIVAFAKEAGRNVLVLGPVPQVPHPDFHHSVPVHLFIEHTGTLGLAVFAGSPERHILCQIPAAADLGDATNAGPLSGLRPSSEIEDAYRAARTARFEHGERG